MPARWCRIKTRTTNARFGPSSAVSHRAEIGKCSGNVRPSAELACERVREAAGRRSCVLCVTRGISNFRKWVTRSEVAPRYDRGGRHSLPLERSCEADALGADER